MIQKRYQEILDRCVENGQASGCAVLLYRNGEELAYASAGVREIGRPDPFTRDTVMLMYSMTKPVTAAAVMTLWDKGLLTPETPVCEFFPEYEQMDIICPDGSLRKAENVLRVKHLLTMTSGIPYHWEEGIAGERFRAMLRGMEEMPAENVTTLELVRGIGNCPLLFEPGTAYVYGLSADVLGGVVEAASGMRFGEYLQKTIFDPLGMKDTAFRPLPHMAGRVARKYDADENGTYTPNDVYMGIPAIDRSPCIEMGGSGLYSTLDDYMKFGEMLRCGGGNIIREETVREMTKNQLPDSISADYIRDNGGFGYGYLVRSLVEENPGTHGEGIGAFGWGGMAGTDLRMDPLRGTTMVWGVQRFPGTAPIAELLDGIKEA